MGAREMGPSKDGKWIVLTDFSRIGGRNAEQVAFLGRRKKNLKILSGLFDGLPFYLENQQIVVDRQYYKKFARKDKNFEQILRATIDDLRAKVLILEGGRELSEQMIKEAFVRAKETLIVTARQAETIALTSGRLTPEHAKRLAGDNIVNLRKISDQIEDAALDIENGKIVVSAAQFVALSPEKRIRLQNILGALEAIVLDGGAIDDAVLGQVFDNSILAHNAMLKDVCEITKEGLQINKKTIYPEELKGSSLFEEGLLIESCPSDPSFVPAQVLTFKKEAGWILSTIMNHQREHANRIRDKFGGVTLSENKLRLTLRGTAEYVEMARACVMEFAKLVKEEGAKAKDKKFAETILSVALGEAETELLDVLRAERKTKQKQQNYGGYIQFSGFNPAAIFSQVSVACFEAKSSNQRIFMEQLEDDSKMVIFGIGPAGVGKTSLAVQTALKKLEAYYTKKPGAQPFTKIYVSMPCKAIGGGDMPPIPGDEFKKTKGWFSSIYAPMAKALSPINEYGVPVMEVGEKYVEDMILNKIIVPVPLGHLRGKSFEYGIVVVDEAQTMSRPEMKALITRPGPNCRYVLLGDPGQRDLFPSRSEKGIVPYKWAEIDANGDLCIRKNGVLLNMGPANLYGRFHKGPEAGVIDVFRPANGLAEALVVAGGDPDVSIARFDLTDVRRSDFVRNVQALYEGAELCFEDETEAPQGIGRKDPKEAYLAAKIPAGKTGEYGASPLRPGDRAFGQTLALGLRIPEKKPGGKPIALTQN